MAEPNPDAAERLRERKRQYYLKNRERILEQARERQARPETRERKREWYAQNKDRLRARQRAYYAANRDKINAWQREHYVRNRERIKAGERFYRHGLRPEDWAAMWDAQDGCCYLCGEEMLPEATNVDHDHACCPGEKSCSLCQRGLTHPVCNVAVGAAGDDPARLRRMADALEIAKARIAARPAQRGEQIDMFATGED